MTKLKKMYIVAGLIIFALFVMIKTETGFVVIEGWKVGVKKSGAEYVMNELSPGYEFFIPGYTTIKDVNCRPVMFNWSKSDGTKTAITTKDDKNEEIIYKPMITGVDKNGIPLSFAIAMEIIPVKSMMAEMFQTTGSYENAMNKKAYQPAKSIIRDVMGSFDAKEIQSKRADVSKLLNSKMSSFFKSNSYFKLDSRVDLKEIEVESSIMKKQLEVQAAKQDTLKEAQRIKQAENAAKTREATAQGEANAVRIAAEGRAAALLLEATAQAKANKLVSESLTPKILENNKILKWNGVVPKVLAGSTTGLFLNLDAGADRNVSY